MMTINIEKATDRPNIDFHETFEKKNKQIAMSVNHHIII